jgi:nucleoid-associated protein YgaU
MGFVDFISNAGKNILGKGNDAEAIKAEIENSFEELPVEGLVVEVDGDTVTLAGVAKDFDTREKAILIAGNVEGISKVNADQLVTQEMLNPDSEENIEIPEEVFYTIEKGDSLWGISEKFYNDGNKYTHIVDANLEVIKDKDLIYPGQTIRIPDIQTA